MIYECTVLVLQEAYEKQIPLRYYYMTAKHEISKLPNGKVFCWQVSNFSLRY